MLSRNTLIEWPCSDDESSSLIERVLFITEAENRLVTIDIDTRNEVALPRWKKYSEVIEALDEGLARIFGEDPTLRYFPPDDEIPEKLRLERDRRWAIIEPLVEYDNVDIFIPARRGRMIRDAETRTGVTKKTILKYLRWYWQGGLNRNALMSHFDNCGGRGKRRQSNVKLGRPSRLSQSSDEPVGVNLTDEDRDNFRRGIREFHEKPRLNGLKATLKKTYQLTMEKYYYSHHETVDGVEVTRLLPAGRRPTYNQFRDFYYTAYDYRQRTIRREGKRAWNLKYRSTTGDSARQAFGPSSEYQIDATIGDIYLLSSIEPGRIIGRPVIYLVTDTFSRMIVGFNVSLEGPSWLGAMLALENVVVDKVAYCQVYGITIREDEWPCRSLPKTLVADRGEFEGYDADNLINVLGVDEVINLPPFRPDWKGIVENRFNILNGELIHWLPGAVYKPRERGDADYRLDATFTLNQFRQLMIHCILYHNNHRRIQNYRKDADMIAEQVEPYPLQLWAWGIENRSGILRDMDPEFVRFGLLPRREATVTEHGIRFDGLYYDCQTAQEEHWFAQARQRRWKVPVAYDPRSTNTIYLYHDAHRKPEPCSLLDANQVFAGHEWKEVLDYFECEKQRAAAVKTRDQAAEAEYHAHRKHIVRQAEADRPSTRGQSKSARVKNIKEHRAREREYERQAAALQESPDDVPELPPSVSGYVPPPSDLEMLRQLREERGKQ